jgi:assimilatory nitrate reductase catalytic subunit
LTDALSGQPAFKHVAARMEKFAARAYGFAVTRKRPISIPADYWALARCSDGWRVEFAAGDDDIDWTAFAISLFGAVSHAETIAYHDRDSAQHRFAVFDGDRLSGAIFVAPQPVCVSRAWAVEQLAKLHSGTRERYRIVAGRSGDAQPDAGATVCSCFNVGVNQIASAAAAGCTSVAAIGAALGAGTNCGSCRAEIRAIINARHVQAAE